MSIQNVMATADIAARRRAGVMAALVVLVVLLALLSLGDRAGAAVAVDA